VNQRRKPGFWAYLSALSCIAVTTAVACGNNSSTSNTPGSSSTTCSLAGRQCQFGCTPDYGCATCQVDTDCQPGAPFCVLGNCAACRTSADCNTGQVCEPALHVCDAPCTANNQCNGVNGLPATCDTTTGSATYGACLGCTAATAATVCPATRPLCDPNRLQCSQCTSRADCGAATPACNIQNGTCVECLVDTDCNGQGACGTDHQCHPFCRSNADCSTNTGRPVCDTQTGACGQCNVNADCAANTANGRLVCNTDNHNCVVCAANTDCPTTAPICRTGGGGGGGALAGTCVQCQTNANCTTAGLTICDAQTGQCVQCQNNGDCAATPNTPTCTNGTCVGA
jgi:hypothetical protein